MTNKLTTTNFFIRLLGLVALILLGFLSFPQPAQAQISTDPNFKVAFIGDSSDGGNFQDVLNLIQSEGAHMVLHQGDFSYSSGPTSSWTNAIDNILGSDFPYLGSSGNHDSWSSNYGSFFKDRLTSMGLDPNIVNSSHSNYSTVYRGLKMVFNREGGDASFTLSQLENDDHIWKICSWHHNRADFQAGGKGNSVSLQTYRNCVDFGAIIATGHEHSYSRTCALTDPGTWSSSNRYGASCTQPSVMQVGANKSFVFVSGLGGASRRDYEAASHDDDAWWSTIYTSNRYCKNTCTIPNCTGSTCQDKSQDVSSYNYTYGALFITFYVDGNPNKARGYFKNVQGNIIDEFDIYASDVPITPGPTPTSGPSPTPTIPPTPIPTAAPGCYVSDTSWQNFSLPTQTGSFTVEYDATPYNNNMDGLTMLSQGPGSSFNDYANLVRFSNTGIIDVRNGGSYSSDTTVNYSANTSYHFRLDVNVPAHTYSVYVTPSGGSSQLLASNYSFRSEQTAISSIDNWGINSGSIATGSHQVCNFQLTSGTVTPTPPPSAPGDLDGNGTVDIFDLVIVGNSFGKNPGDTGYDSRADANGSGGAIDIFDLILVGSNFGNPGTPTPSPTGSNNPTPTPISGNINHSVCNPDNGSSSFTTYIDNQYLPFSTGMQNDHVIYNSGTGERVRFRILGQIKQVYGTDGVDPVDALVLEEYETINGNWTETSHNWFAQTQDGTVCYFGEDVYLPGSPGGDGHGSWEAGINGARAGIMMPPNPIVGNTWMIEDAPNDGAVEDAIVISTGDTYATPAGTFQNVIYIEEDNHASQKRYAPGIGMIFDDGLELISF